LISFSQTFRDELRNNEKSMQLCRQLAKESLNKNITLLSFEADSHADGINVHGIHSHSPTRDIELTFDVANILFCRKCNHRFHVKILDQGIKNTNVYFDNTLT
jgi:hypothetical protein